MRLRTLVLAALMVVTTLIPATTASATPNPAMPSARSAIIARGPDWVLVGSGHHVTGNNHLAIPAARATVFNCGWATCSVYFSRSTTRNFHYNIDLYGGGIASLGALCTLSAFLSGVAAIATGAACGVVVAAGGAFLLNAIDHAASDNGCLRIRGPLPFGFYDDHSGYCRN